MPLLTQDIKNLTCIAVTKHEYIIEQKPGQLSLEAKFDGDAVPDKTLDKASPLDHMIWDEIDKSDGINCCESVTIWSDDVEFNLLLFINSHKPEKLTCAYFPAPDKHLQDLNKRYWNGVNWEQPAPDTMGTKANGIDPLKMQALEGRLKGTVNVPHLTELVVWNRFDLTNCNRGMKFTRSHAVILDPFRKYTQSIPLPTNWLLQDWEKKPCWSLRDDGEAARCLYELVHERYSWVAGCGSAMKRNLSNLASLLVDSKIGVALVTGKPGTGKENLCKALYFANKLRKPEASENEGIFLQTTAQELENKLEVAKKGHGDFEPSLSAILTGLVSREAGSERSRAKSPVLFIDELNKASQQILAGLLRPLEQGAEELGVDGSPIFILAASEHIDDLARKPPQDFWTRITHQLRVVHPLSLVSEDDAERFLKAFFFSQWSKMTESLINRINNDEMQMAVKELFLGTVTEAPPEKFKASALCGTVKDEFLNTLVPLVSRDTLSVRGARSMLSQVFARVSWYVRFENPLELNASEEMPTINEKAKKDIARQVNSAVQDVMAILNAARSTPATVKPD